MERSCSSVSEWNTTMSSTRLRNSGLKSFLTSDIAVLVDGPVVEAAAGALHREAQGRGPGDLAGTDVARHDDDGVAEVDLAPLAVGEAALLEDLEQDVEEVGVGLLDLVEEHDEIGLWRTALVSSPPSS